MAIPVYSEISNFSITNFSKKESFFISVVFITDNLSSSIESLNSIYKFISKKKSNCELIIINLDRITYNYDTIFSTFPFVRIFFPQEKANLKDLFRLGINESLSKNILFLNQKFSIINLDLDILNIYLSESSFGIIVPLVISQKEEIIPNIIKMDIKNGFLNTFSMDIKGTTISSLYPKYFCFIINKNAFLSNLDLYEYENEKYFLLELGYRIWKMGFIITQTRNFKVVFSEKEYPDITKNEEIEYFIFNIRNITDNKLKRGRMWKMTLFMLKKLVFFDFSSVLKIYRIKREIRKNRIIPPIEDSAILTIINKDIP